MHEMNLLGREPSATVWRTNQGCRDDLDIVLAFP